MALKLQGKQVCLRALAADDLGPLAQLLQAPAVARWWGAYDEDRLRRELLDDPTAEAFAVEAEGRLVGVVDFREQQDPDYHNAALDISIGAPYQRRGLGSDAFRTLIAYLVDERGHHRLTVDPAADNLEAIRFYHKLGFERVGVMRCYERLPGGGWRDGLLMEFIVCDSEPQPNVPEREE